MGAAPRPERILAVRDLLGLSLQELGTSAGFSQSYFSEIASGKRPFSLAHAEQIATATGFPTEFFLVEAPQVEADSLQFRKLKTSKAATTRKASQYFRETSRITQDVSRAAGLKPKALPFVNDATTGTLEDSVIEQAAAATRQLMGVSADAAIPNMTRAIERLGIVVAPVLLDPLEDEVRVVSEGHFGISHGDQLGVPVVGYFPGKSPDRDRFTLAHEVGHVVLHSHRTADDPEPEANRFAGALLLPEDTARSELHAQITLNQLARLKARYGISIQALIMRAAGLSIIDQKRQRSLFVQLNVRGWRQNEPVEVGAEYPLLLRKLIEASLPPNATSKDVENVTALPRAYVRAIAPPPPRRSTDSLAPAVKFARPNVAK